jgi:hypothetical protein
MNRGIVTFVTLMIAVSLSACGGDEGSDTTSPSEWADSLCSDLSEWKSSVESVAGSLGGSDLSQEQVQDVVNEVAASTEMLVGNLQDLGRPDTEAGQEAEDAVNQLADEIQTGIGEMERAAAGVSSSTDALQAASSIRATATTMSDEVSSTLTSVGQQNELKGALEQSEACRDLSSS